MDRTLPYSRRCVHELEHKHIMFTHLNYPEMKTRAKQREIDGKRERERERDEEKERRGERRSTFVRVEILG